MLRVVRLGLLSGSFRGPPQVGRAVSLTAGVRRSALLARRGGGSALSALGREPRGPSGTARPGARRAQTLALSDSPLAGVGDRGPDGNGASMLWQMPALYDCERSLIPTNDG
jgi:hypothetical protein